MFYLTIPLKKSVINQDFLRSKCKSGFNYFSDNFWTRSDFCREGVQAFPGTFTTAQTRSKERGESEPGPQFGKEDLTYNGSREKENGKK